MKLYQLVKKYSISKPLFVAYFVFFALIFYFIFTLFFGQKGVVAMLKLNEEIANRNQTKQELIDEFEAKKNKVKGLSNESLDLDLLDEESRKNLGHVSKDEIIIYQEKKEK